MNSYPSRTLRSIPASPTAARPARMTGQDEVRALAGRPIAPITSAQPEVQQDAPRATPIRMLRLSQVAAITGLSKTKIYQLPDSGRFPNASAAISQTCRLG